MPAQYKAPLKMLLARMDEELVIAELAAWAAYHGEHFAEKAPVMRRDPAQLAADPAACLQCHFNQIHDADLVRRLQEQER